MIFLAPQRPSAALDAFLSGAPGVRSFAPETGAIAAIAAGEVLTLAAQPSRFALWLRTGEAARVLAANPALSELVTIAIVGGDSGVARLDDGAMPAALPLPEGVVAGDLKGVLNGVYVNLGGQSVTLSPLDVATLPEAKPANGVANWRDTRAIGRWRIWKDGDAIKVDNLRSDDDTANFFTSLTVQITRETAIAHGLATAAALPLTWGGASVPNNAPLHREGDALLAILPPNAQFNLTFEDDTTITNLAYSAVLGELEDYPAVKGALVRREFASTGLTGLAHLRTIENPRLMMDVVLRNHNIDQDAHLLSHIAKIGGVGVLPFGTFANDKTNASWARPEICRFVQATKFSGWSGWGGVNDSGASGTIRFQEVREHTNEVPPFVPPQDADYLLLTDGCRLRLASGDGFLRLAA